MDALPGRKAKDKGGELPGGVFAFKEVKMETIVSEDRIEEAEVEAAEQPEPATVTAAKLFRYSEFVDVGEGAIECEHSRDGACEDVGHFHAWVRLPNPFQHQDVRKKAMAAKARRIRDLKDPESDASVILDQDLSRANDPSFASALIEELLARDWASDYLEAQKDVEEREEYEHINEDRSEFNRLKGEQEPLSEEEQSAEYKSLRKHMDGYVTALRERLEEVQVPKREQFEARSAEDLISLIRDQRVEEEADKTFIDTYNAWMWFVGTLKVHLHPTLGRPHLPMWEQIGSRERSEYGTMFGAEPEVIDEIKSAFNRLQLAMQEGSSGN